MSAGAVYGNPTLFTESVSAVTATNTVALGTMRWEGGNQYRYVYANVAAVIVPGYFADYISGGSGYSITNVITTVGDSVAGVVQNTTMTTGTYGWLMIKGLAKINTGANSALSANRKIVVLASGTVGDFIANQAATGVSGILGQMTIGRTITSSTASGLSILCYVSC